MIYEENIFSMKSTVAQNGYTDSKSFPVPQGDVPLWKFALMSYFTSVGAATMKYEVYVSPDNVNWFDLDTDIIATVAKDVWSYKGFTPTLCVAMKIRATEENTAAVTGLVGHLLMG